MITMPNEGVLREHLIAATAWVAEQMQAHRVRRDLHPDRQGSLLENHVENAVKLIPHVAVNPMKDVPEVH